ncbi:hypothetical protein Fuma_02307 [Fuerstiella marisgermanici]|uniref:Uncharacterized protein n=1 Tax=Fuerstiella marisgermanici TaxID=1891926 RepID=A0A1P8WF57_9PLAN|nr:hypothetical protein Fuma_02307 [Fuerstiella marisgermanici]
MRLFDHDHFEATVVIFTHDLGGRISAPFNGIRWGFCYAEDAPTSGIYMIHQTFWMHPDNRCQLIRLCWRVSASLIAG